MNTFAQAVQDDVNSQVTTTTNGMAAHVTTNDAVLDFFTEAGSARGKDLTAQFLKAYHENEDLAVRALLWTRDVRGGAGERAVFRYILESMQKHDPALVTRLLVKIPEIGRWDDLLILLKKNDDVSLKVIELIKSALESGNGLCAKWMPRKGEIAVALRNHFGWSPKHYRKTLVTLSDTVEQKMCANEWSNIEYNKIPSLASARYQAAFERHDSDGYNDFIAALAKGDTKINAEAVYPYDIVKSLGRGNAQVANAQWDTLPNYIGDAKVFPMVDVSGSMSCKAGGYDSKSNLTCMDVAISLGLYCSDKTNSSFKNMFLTFSANPEIVTAKGSLSEKVAQMRQADWGMNTNLNAAFDKLLEVAVNGNVSPDEMPGYLLILSDMQFDASQRSYYTTRKGMSVFAQDMIKEKYSNAGYIMPKIVFWNLDSGIGNTPVKMNDYGMAEISGFSPAIMKSILSDDLETFTPINVMLETLMVERYNW